MANNHSPTDSITQDEINAILWKACDTFRGTVDPSEYKNYILVMPFLKYISDVWLDQSEQYRQQFGDDLQTAGYLADVAIELERMIDARKIRDWTANPDVQNAMKTDIEDYLYQLKDVDGLPIGGPEMDTIIENVIDVARKRDRLFE